MNDQSNASAASSMQHQFFWPEITFKVGGVARTGAGAEAFDPTEVWETYDIVDT
jgi:hypothetical protein